MKSFLIFALIPLIALSMSDLYAQSDYSPRDVSIKGSLTQSQSFVGDVFWVILEQDKGVLVATSDKGVIVIRFDFKDHDKCYDTPDTFCLSATIQETKNTFFTQVGDEVNIIIEYPEKLTFSVLSGKLVANNFEITIEKLREI